MLKILALLICLRSRFAGIHAQESLTVDAATELAVSWFNEGDVQGVAKDEASRLKNAAIDLLTRVVEGPKTKPRFINERII